MKYPLHMTLYIYAHYLVMILQSTIQSSLPVGNKIHGIVFELAHCNCIQQWYVYCSTRQTVWMLLDWTNFLGFPMYLYRSIDHKWVDWQVWAFLESLANSHFFWSYTCTCSWTVIWVVIFWGDDNYTPSAYLHALYKYNQFYKTLEHYSTVLGCLVTYNKYTYTHSHSRTCTPGPTLTHTYSHSQTHHHIHTHSVPAYT